MEYKYQYDHAAQVRAEFERREAIRREDAEKRRIAEEGRAAIAAVEDERVRELLHMADRLLSLGLGSDNGYFPSVGATDTRRLRAAVAAFGVVPDYDAVRVKRYPNQNDSLMDRPIAA